MVAAQTGVPHEDVLLEAVKRIYAKGGRVTMLDEENPGAATCLPHAQYRTSLLPSLVSLCPFYSDPAGEGMGGHVLYIFCAATH